MDMNIEFDAIWQQIYEAFHDNTLQSLSKEVLNSNVRDEIGYTLLHNACNWDQNDQVEIVRLLLDSGVDVNSVDNDGYTPLHIACIYEHPEVVELLLKYGADVNKSNNDGKTPCHFAIRNPDIVKVLLRNGADIYIPDNKGRTVYEKSSLRDTEKIIQEVLVQEHLELIKLKEDYIKLQNEKNIKPQVQELIVAAALMVKNLKL
jgi:ankyrin repeat protein